VREVAWEFTELSLRSVDVKEVIAIGAFLDLRDFSTTTGELDVVANLEVSHRLNRRITY
jgi:hypothetical protein